MASLLLLLLLLHATVQAVCNCLLTILLLIQAAATLPLQRLHAAMASMASQIAQPLLMLVPTVARDMLLLYIRCYIGKIL